MITANLIIVGLAIMSLPIFALIWLGKKKQYVAAFLLSCVMMGASLYCLYAGFHLAIGWQDPFANMDPKRVSNAAAHIRKGGAVVMVIKFWPYVLIALGGHFSWFNVSNVWGNYKLVQRSVP